jgi:hypothetical protein
MSLAAKFNELVFFPRRIEQAGKRRSQESKEASHRSPKRIIASSAFRSSAKLVKGAILKTYKGFPHGMHGTNPDTVNADLQAFIQS